MGSSIRDNIRLNHKRGVSITLPTMLGAASCNAYGSGIDPRRNLIDPRNPRRQRGGALPESFDNYARFTGGLDTVPATRSLWSGVQATAEWTWIMVARPVLPDGAGHYPLVGNSGSIWPTSGAAIGGQAMLLTNNTANDSLLRLTGQSSVHDGATVTTTTASAVPDFNASTTGWQIFMVRRMADGTVIADIVGSTVPRAQSASALPAALGGEIIIGSQANGANIKQIDVAFDIFHVAGLTDAQAYANCRLAFDFCAAVGVAITAPAGIPVL